MLDKKPYLIRAIYEWIADNHWIPHIVVDAEVNPCQVPVQYVQDGHIVLNVAFSAVQNLMMADESISFDASFGGKSMSVFFPVASVTGIYARENGDGLSFQSHVFEPVDANAIDTEVVAAKPVTKKPKPRFSVVPKSD